MLLRRSQILKRLLTHNRGVSTVGTEDHKTELRPIGIIGAPFELGQPFTGPVLAPDELRKAGLIDKLKLFGYDVKDYGNLIHDPSEEENPKGPENKLFKPNNVINYNRILRHKVAEILREGRFCLTLGGDHSVGLGTISGFQSVFPDSCCIWVDAHADINDPESSTTGHMHGMPLNFHVKELKKNNNLLPKWDDSPALSASHLAYIALRDVDPPERAVLNKLNIVSYSMKDIDHLGMNTVVQRILEKINPKNKRSIHVSFDIDALDPLEAPSTGTKVRGGLTLREGMVILERCLSTGRFAALDLVEINTRLSDEKDAQTTLKAGEHLIMAAVGADV